MKYFFAKKNTGFTLLETLVAISILSLSIAGAFSVAQSGLSSAILARDQIVAFQLAQEAVELVRNIRDNNTHQNQDWLTGLTSCIDVNCAVNIKTRLVAPCTDACKVQKDAQGFYIQNSSGSNPTGFKRTVRLEKVPSTVSIPDAQEVKITVKMEWQKGSLVRDFTVVEHMFNWQEGYPL
ncbi:MAG: hypothetical protein RJA61_626 [Candidatus Parcubacteria bacterium]|jgi:prepilin-type N-terminal cleavage/methylation domain-containing protein